MLLDQLDQQLRITEEECRGYKEFLEHLESRDETQTEEDYDKILKEVQLSPLKNVFQYGTDDLIPTVGHC